MWTIDSPPKLSFQCRRPAVKLDDLLALQRHTTRVTGSLSLWLSFITTWLVRERIFKDYVDICLVMSITTKTMHRRILQHPSMYEWHAAAGRPPSFLARLTVGRNRSNNLNYGLSFITHRVSRKKRLPAAVRARIAEKLSQMNT